MTLPEKQAVKSIMKTFEVIPTEKPAPKPARPKAPEKTAESLNAAYLKYMRKSAV
jgi:BRCT domain type II-containing protein